MMGLRVFGIVAACMAILWGIYFLMVGEYHVAGLNMNVAFWAALYADVDGCKGEG